MAGYGENPYGQNYATGGGGGGGGGGFMMGGSQGDSASKGGSSAKNTLRPVTIRQIISATQAHPDAEFKIDDQELGQLTFCAVIRNISRNATNISYTVEDGTGEIEVRQWLDSTSDDSGKAADIKTNTYVRVLGTVKAFQSKRSVSAGHIRPVDSYNEVLYHKMEAVWVHLQITKGTTSNGAGGQTGDYSNSTPVNGGGGADLTAISNPTQRKIAQAIHTLVTPDSEGITVQQVASKLQGLSVGQITKEIDEMVNNGFLYHTIDDDHFLPP